jgi:hypothetical protein
MDWTVNLRLHTRVNRLDAIHYQTRDNGVRFYYISNGYLKFTALYDTLEEGRACFMADYQRSDNGQCATCGRAITGRGRGAIYCSDRCNRGAEAQRRKKSAA